MWHLVSCIIRPLRLEKDCLLATLLALQIANPYKARFCGQVASLTLVAIVSRLVARGNHGWRYVDVGFGPTDIPTGVEESKSVLTFLPRSGIEEGSNIGRFANLLPLMCQYGHRTATMRFRIATTTCRIILSANREGRRVLTTSQPKSNMRLFS
jgi:hypothetical protein